jgi:hypothetical protein
MASSSRRCRARITTSARRSRRRQGPGPRPRSRELALGLAALLVLAACSDATGPGDETPAGPTTPVDSAPQSLAACTSAPPFTRALVEPADLVEVSPLAFVSPPGKVFPTPHLGFSTFWEPGMAGAETAPVWAPADIVVTEVAFVRYTSVQTGEVVLEDYALRFQPCREILMYLGHMSEVAPAVLDSAGPFSGPGAECPDPYVAVNNIVEGCFKRTEFRVAAGERLGTMGGVGQSAMDVGLYDHTRPPLAYVNPERTGGGGMLDNNFIACPVDYFVPAIRSAYLALNPRTAPPRCGEMMQDVAGTLQGRWFVDDQQGDNRHMGFFMDWLDPEHLVVSMGHSVPSIPIGGYWLRPVSAAEAPARVNPAFREVTPGPDIHCFERREGGGRWIEDLVILVRLEAADRLRVEGGDRTACGDPASWSLSNAAVEFRR